MQLVSFPESFIPLTECFICSAPPGKCADIQLRIYNCKQNLSFSHLLCCCPVGVPKAWTVWKPPSDACQHKTPYSRKYRTMIWLKKTTWLAEWLLQSFIMFTPTGTLVSLVRKRRQESYVSLNVRLLCIGACFESQKCWHSSFLKDSLAGSR